jgi:arylsulfatase I/J
VHAHARGLHDRPLSDALRAPDRRHIPSGGKYGLATDEWLLPEALKEAGYATALVGKWHLGHASQEYWPQQRGFDYSYGPLIGEIDHFKHESHGIVDWYRNSEKLEEPGYDTTLFGADAVRLIEAHQPEKPLFLYLAFTAPHTPYQSPEEYQARHSNITDPQRRAYAGMIAAMDDEVGNVLAALERRGMRDNTLLFFMSDNGGTRSEMFAGEGAVEGELPPSNGNYRDGKGSVYEGGTRAVALANWPGHIGAGVVDEMMHMVDMYPTIAGLAAADLGKTKPLDGVDVWQAISEGKASPRTEVVYNVEPYRAAVRQGDMKLVWVSLLPQKVELFDLAKDPAEANNLAGERKEDVAMLQDRVLALSVEAKPPLFLSEIIHIGLSAAPAFPTGISRRAGFTRINARADWARSEPKDGIGDGSAAVHRQDGVDSRRRVRHGVGSPLSGGGAGAQGRRRRVPHRPWASDQPGVPAVR